ncbi:unnamed protein product, partial [marine sediment metagenome]
DLSIRYKVLVKILGENPNSKEIEDLQHQIKISRRVQSLLSERDSDGRIPFHPYRKWYGAHWVLTSLAELHYPSGDKTLIPLREQIYEWLFSKKQLNDFKNIDGRVRIHASMEGNAIYYLLSLGIADNRTDELVKRLLMYQWQDGGWNCDKKPKAMKSSFMESLIPLRAMICYAKLKKNSDAKNASIKASDIFLKRKLFKSKKKGEIIKEDFITLHYPCYWHYDILFGLKVLAEGSFITDPRCKDALDLLESKKLPDGGFPAEKKYYVATD